MYKLWNFLFGWDYIQWRNTADTGIARVHTDYDGVIWHWRYKGVKIIDRMKDPSKYIWLTCSSSKYFKGE